MCTISSKTTLLDSQGNLRYKDFPSDLVLLHYLVKLDK